MSVCSILYVVMLYYITFLLLLPALAPDGAAAALHTH